MGKKKKPKITKGEKKTTIHLEKKKVGIGFNPAKKSGAGTHGGSVKEKNRRNRKGIKKDLRGWDGE